MPIFTGAQHVNISGGSFTDVQGGVHNYHTDPLFQLLLPATATGAAHNSVERYPPPKCHPGTRQPILEEIQEWTARGETGGPGGVMWLHGPAGAGKSAIAQTMCEFSADRGQLVASFFFSREDNLRNAIYSVVTTIAFQMAMLARDLRDQIAQVVHDNPLVVHEASIALQMERLIVSPLRSRSPNPELTAVEPNPFLIVVDGLDECRGNDNQCLLLNNFIDLIRIHHLPLYVLIVSRPEPHITHVFENITNDVKLQVLSLYGGHQAKSDIRRFLKDGFKKIHDSERHSHIMKFVPKPWPSQRIIDILVHNSGGYFIYASTVLLFVGEEYFSPLDRLKEVLNSSPTSQTSAFAELDKLYAQILSTSSKPALLKLILGCILLPVDGQLYNNDEVSGMPSSMMEQYFGLQPGEIMLTLRGLHSLLTFESRSERQSDLAPVRIETYVSSIHASLADFALNKDRAGIFFINAQQHHIDMAFNSWTSLCNWSKTADTALPLSQYLLGGLAFHFSHIEDKSETLQYLKISRLATWAPLISASQGWEIPEKHLLVGALEVIYSMLQAVVPLPQAALDELDTIFALMYTSHLAMRSEIDLQFIHGTLTMNLTPWIMGYNSSCWDIAGFLKLPQSVDNSWWYLHRYLNTCEPSRVLASCAHAKDPIRSQPSFVKFMSDPGRCGGLFVDSAAWNAHVAVCCLENIAEGNSSSRAYRYAKDHLPAHLSRASPGEKRVLDYLRRINNFYPFYYGTSQLYLDPLAHAIMTWLQRIPNTPMDILLPWIAFGQEFKSGRR